MHPVIRLACFLVFAAFLTREGAPGLVFAAVLLGALFVVAGGAGLGASARMLRRLRWLFMSLLVVYLWFTPGTPIAGPADSPWVPTWQGATQGTERIAALVLIVLAVNLLIARTARPKLLAAIHWVSYPLRFFGCSRDRFALRLVLAMEAVAMLQPLLAARRALLRHSTKSIVARLGDAAAELFGETLRRAEEAPCTPHVVPALAAPVWWQWGYPLLLTGAFLSLT